MRESHESFRQFWLRVWAFILPGASVTGKRPREYEFKDVEHFVLCFLTYLASNPEGPCTQLVYTLAAEYLCRYIVTALKPKSILCGYMDPNSIYFGPKVFQPNEYTTWAHGP